MYYLISLSRYWYIKVSMYAGCTCVQKKTRVQECMYTCSAVNRLCEVGDHLELEVFSLCEHHSRHLIDEISYIYILQYIKNESNLMMTLYFNM